MIGEGQRWLDWERDRNNAVGIANSDPATNPSFLSVGELILVVGGFWLAGVEQVP
jgi:hypothetical protein